jgi:GDP-L-fucose synthase
VVDRLTAAGHDALPLTRLDADLTEASRAHACIAGHAPDAVVHLAGRVGGLADSIAHPGDSFRENLLMGVHVLEACRALSVGRALMAGTVCSYPKDAPQPLREETLWDGAPEPTNGPYGVAKRALVTMAQAYRAQYGLRASTVLLANLYGPGDNFEPARSHVIPAMIVRMTAAKMSGEREVTLWGDGTATRSFLFVQDAAEGIVRALERYDSPEPVNLGSDEEISIAELARHVAAEVGYTGRVGWDPSKPVGQPRRAVDTTRASAWWRAETPLVVGLRQTVAWYLRDRHRTARMT